MGLLTGSASVTRCVATKRPEEPDFEALAFEEILPGSSIRERVGFLPYEPGAAYRIGQQRWAFRVRIDTLKPDRVAVAERLKEMIVAEKEATGTPFVHPRKKRNLKQLAEEELLLKATPRSKVIECCLDDHTLWIGTTANSVIGMILGLLYQMGVVSDFETPWMHTDSDDVPEEVLDRFEPWQSPLGCRFLRRLLEDPEVAVEPEKGSVRLATRDARITLSGAVMPDLLRYVERGAEILSAKMVTSEATFRFDALNFRLSAMRVDTESHEHWEELLDERLERIENTFDLLDRKYDALRSVLEKGRSQG